MVYSRWVGWGQKVDGVGTGKKGCVGGGVDRDWFERVVIGVGIIDILAEVEVVPAVVIMLGVEHLTEVVVKWHGCFVVLFGCWWRSELGDVVGVGGYWDGCGVWWGIGWIGLDGRGG